MDKKTHLVCPHCGQLNRLPAARIADKPTCGSCGKTLISGQPIALDDGNFGRFIDKNELPVVVDFWAAWCGPCKMMAPVFEQAAAQLAGRVIMAKLDTDHAPNSAARFDIRSIPTVILFSGGREVVRQAGALDLRRLLAFIENHL